LSSLENAIIYCRFSPGREQTEQSIEGQVRVCTEYAKAHGLEVVDTYADRKISGRRDDRPEFQRMIADSGKKNWSVVLVYRTDRFGRSKYDIAVYKHMLKQHGVRVIPVAEAAVEGPEGIILEALMEGMAEYYSAELSQKVARGMRESAFKGKATGGTRVFGYRTAPNKSYFVDEEEARLVTRIFDDYISGVPVKSICRYLNGLGLKSTRGKSFSSGAITGMIHNAKYTGVYKFGGITIDGGMPQIIDQQKFDLAQRETRRRQSGRRPAQPKADYLLSGRLFCGHCKAAMVGVSGTSHTGDKYHYYQCPDKRRGKCTKEHVRRDWLETFVAMETIRHVLRVDFIPALAHLVYLTQAANDTTADEIKHYKRLLSENEKARANIIKAVEAGMLTPALPKRMEELEQEAENLRGEIAFLQSKDVALTEEQIGFFLVEFSHPEDGESIEHYNRKIIECFVSAVYLYNDKIIIYFNVKKGEVLDSIEVDAIADGSHGDGSSPLQSIRTRTG
jgi:DNA invertase Pin-like site-specific DNA recombinase